MADASISQLIVLVVSLSIAVTVGGMVMQTAGMVSGSIERKGSDISRQIATDIKIISDPDHMMENINGDNELVLYVKNIGSTTLENSHKVIDVFIDGKYLYKENIDNLKIMDDGKSWSPSRVLKIITNYSRRSLDTGSDHKAKVVVYNNEDTLKFRV